MIFTIVTGAFQPVPPGEGGAVERRWYGAAKELAARGHEVTMVGKLAPGLAADTKVDGVRVLRHTSYSQTGRLSIDLLKDFCYAARIRNLVPASDVIVSCDFFFPLLRPPRKAEKFFVNVARIPKGQMRLYSRADRFLVPSKAMESALVREGVDIGKITILPNPVDVSIFHRGDDRSFIPPWRLLFAGRIHPEKGIPIFIDAVKKLVERGISIEARIIGPYQKSQGGGGDAYRAQLMARARGLPIDFLEPIFDRPALAQQYRWAHFFVYPSIAEKGESFGVAPVEAMSTGAIPVVSALECFDEFMSDDVGERFDHRTTEPGEMLMSAILRALEGSLDQRSNRAAQSASRFSYPAVADQLLELVSSFCREGNRTGD